MIKSNIILTPGEDTEAVLFEEGPEWGDGMVAFWDGKSGGTWNAMEHAKALGKSVEVFNI